MTCQTLFFTFLLGLLLFSSCKNDEKGTENTQQENIVEIPESELADVDSSASPVPQPQLPAPLKSSQKKEVEKEQESISPFKSLGCCADDTKRLSEDCCCNEVLLSYKKMFESNNKDLVKLRDTDPILADCRNKLKKEFYEIDYPPGNEDEDESSL